MVIIIVYWAPKPCSNWAPGYTSFTSTYGDGPYVVPDDNRLASMDILQTRPASIFRARRKRLICGISDVELLLVRLLVCQNHIAPRREHTPGDRKFHPEFRNPSDRNSGPFISHPLYSGVAGGRKRAHSRPVEAYVERCRYFTVLCPHVRHVTKEPWLYTA